MFDRRGYLYTLISRPRNCAPALCAAHSKLPSTGSTITQPRKKQTIQRTHNPAPYIPVNELGPDSLTGKPPFLEGKKLDWPVARVRAHIENPPLHPGERVGLWGLEPFFWYFDFLFSFFFARQTPAKVIINWSVYLACIRMASTPYAI